MLVTKAVLKRRKRRTSRFLVVFLSDCDRSSNKSLVYQFKLHTAKMMRSSSRSHLLDRARSVRNIGKVPFKFKIELSIDTIDKLTYDGEVVVVWDRGSNKVECTAAVQVDHNTRKATFVDETMVQDVTMYKSQADSEAFLEKVIKLAVRADDQNGKTLGKIHLNLAEYVELASDFKKISAELSNGSTLILGLKCDSLSTAGTLPTATTLSVAEKRGSKSELSLSDMSEASESPLTPVDTMEDTPRNLLKNKLKMKRAASKKIINRERKSKSNVIAGTDVNDIVQLKRENSRLRKRLEENNTSSSEKDREENSRLKKELDEFRFALSREPVFDDVVQELKDVKLAITSANVEIAKLEKKLKEWRGGKRRHGRK